MARKPISGELGMDTWTRYRFKYLQFRRRAHALTTVRDAGPGYKNTIFIALHPAAPNLTFPGVDVNVDVPDHDLDTESERTGSSDEGGMESGVDDSIRSYTADDEGDGTENHKHPGSEPKSERDTLRDSEDKKGSRTETEESEGPENRRSKSVSEDLKIGPNLFDVFPDTSLWDPFPPAHNSLMRSMKNISKPDHSKDHVWWRSMPLTHFKDFNSVQPLLVDLIDSSVAEQLNVNVFYANIRKYITDPLEHMLDLASQIMYLQHDDDLDEKFGYLFGVGPGGINILLPILTFLYQGLARIRSAGFTLDEDSRKMEYALQETSRAFLVCVKHFRDTYHRSLWDPKGGFRELAYILHKHDQDLPVFLDLILVLSSVLKIISTQVGEAGNTMHVHVNNMDLRRDPINTLRQSLTDAFGVIIGRLLDEIDRVDYEDVFKLFMDSCRALARKCGNYIKSQTKPGHGAKPKSAQAPSNDDTAVSFQLCRGEPDLVHVGTPNTRTDKGSGHFKTRREPNYQFKYAKELFSDTAEDMTGTESAADDWYYHLRPGPGIKTRRKRRHTREFVPSSESEDYLPGPKPKPRARPEWVDVETPSPSPVTGPEIVPRTQHELNLQEAEALGMLSWFKMRRQILTHFPHPDNNRRKVLNGVNLLSDSDQYRRLSAVYHPDRNVTQPKEWQELTAKIMTAINDRRRT
ncbi:hypothetical protein DFH07DRAFT_1030484 [Mycena maculata]|uniref:J domain-containing protein n=1 Tax=Mycena maculata TaxID=230809 RepID=A0AAD7NC75_9AGAR|nr:hypothetical protein DFH07DRAFT_1030484 [Mycena maculata]